MWLQDPPLVGTDVVELQERLKELGFYRGVVDGIYDWEVERAVRDFQMDNGLNPDGIVQDHLWIRLADKEVSVSNKEKQEGPKGGKNNSRYFPFKINSP